MSGKSDSRNSAEKIGFFEARRKMIEEFGGYNNLHLLFSDPRYQRQLRKAKAGQLSRAELLLSLSQIRSFVSGSGSDQSHRRDFQNHRHLEELNDLARLRSISSDDRQYQLSSRQRTKAATVFIEEHPEFTHLKDEARHDGDLYSAVAAEVSLSGDANERQVFVADLRRILASSMVGEMRSTQEDNLSHDMSAESFQAILLDQPINAVTVANDHDYRLNETLFNQRATQTFQDLLAPIASLASEANYAVTKALILASDPHATEAQKHASFKGVELYRSKICEGLAAIEIQLGDALCHQFENEGINIDRQTISNLARRVTSSIKLTDSITEFYEKSILAEKAEDRSLHVGADIPVNSYREQLKTDNVATYSYNEARP